MEVLSLFLLFLFLLFSSRVSFVADEFGMSVGEVEEAVEDGNLSHVFVGAAK
jgi:hypothetical protein